MRFIRLAVALLPLLLAGCGLTAQQQADLGAVQRSGVYPATYDKMVHGDDLALADIMNLSHAGVNDAITLRYLRDRQTVYHLTTFDVGDLRQAGVSRSVIDFMLQTPQLFTNYYPAIGLGFGYTPYYDPPWDGFWGPPYPSYPYPPRHWH